MTPRSAVTASPSSRFAELSLLLMAALLGLACCGHFIKPHGDFFEFRETGRALMAGRLPDTLKRAPVYPLAIALGGAALEKLTPLLALARPADQSAAEWLNALLLPANAWLAMRLARSWCGGSAFWAVWFTLLPIGLYCTAHTLVEPLLICEVLATLLLVQRNSAAAWIAAALASMTRYDAAGLLLALLFMRGSAPRRQHWQRAAAAFAPLLIWLTLTVLTWSTRSDDHYLRQFLEPGRQPGSVVWGASSQLFDPTSLRLPVWLDDLRGPLLFGLSLTLAALLIVGAARLLRNDRAARVAAVFAAGYVLVHELFPFQLPRFAYPLTPLILLFAGAGWQTLRTYMPQKGLPVIGHFVLLGITLALMGLCVAAEAGDLIQMLQARPAWSRLLPFAAVAGAIAVGIGGEHNSTFTSAARRIAKTAVTCALMLALAISQSLAALPILGDGTEMRGLVQAAQWIEHELPQDTPVLSGAAGLLRLHCGLEPAGRFPGFEQIKAARWAEILDECRASGIDYIVWHDEMLTEQGGYYIEKARLRRFEQLSMPEPPPGLELLREFPAPPHVRVFRVTPAGRPPRAESSTGDGSTDTAPAPGGLGAPLPPRTYP